MGTKKWIGTTEIYTLLTSAGFRFLHRAQCPNPVRCLVHDFDMRKPPHTASLVKYVEDYFKCADPGISNSDHPTCRISDRPPLYFQHSGHSRTIVGIEHLKSKAINLLIFDPNHKPSSSVKDAASGKVREKLSDHVLTAFRVSLNDIAKRKEYQILRYHNVIFSLMSIDYRKERLILWKSRLETGCISSR